MSRYIDVENYCENFCHCNNEYCDKSNCPILNAPTADVAEVKHGKWIKMYNNPSDGNYYCSECHKYRDIVTGRKTPRDRDFSYCPNCGARMDGGHE